MKRWLLLGACLSALAFGSRPLVGAQRHPVPARDATPEGETPRLRVEEWGVWMVEEGRVTLEALAAESPSFVVRAALDVRPPSSTTPRPVPVVRPNPVTVRKPVLFFHASEPLAVTVDVRFPGGRAWLLYPSASEASARRLVWNGVVRGEGTPPQAPTGHWWNDLRAVGADGFATDRGGFERFVFYDGQVRYRTLFRFGPGADASRRRGQPPTDPTIRPAPGAEGPLFIVREGSFVEHDRVDAAWREVGRAPVTELRGRMERAIRARGLAEAETRALLDVWRDELEASAAHAISFVPRREYDRMLPIRITARAERTSGRREAEVDVVRVGLVIERL